MGEIFFPAISELFCVLSRAHEHFINRLLSPGGLRAANAVQNCDREHRAVLWRAPDLGHQLPHRRGWLISKPLRDLEDFLPRDGRNLRVASEGQGYRGF